MRNLFLVSFLFFIGNTSQLRAQGFGIQWQKTYGGSAEEDLSNVISTADGGFLMAGGTLSGNGDVTGYQGNVDAWLVKTDAAGTLQWEKTYGGPKDDFASAIRPTADGGYVMLCGTSSVSGDVPIRHGDDLEYDYWVVKLSATGAIEWNRAYGGTQNEVAASIQQTFDGGYILAGYSNSNDSGVNGHHGTALTSDYWVVKINATGDTAWERSLGGSQEDEARAVIQAADSSYVVVGHSSSPNDGDVTGNHGGDDIWVVKLSQAGAIIWEKSIGGPGEEDASDIKQTPDGGYIITGYADANGGQVTGNHGSQDVWLVKLNANGNLLWQKSYGGTARETAYGVTIARDSSYIVTGRTGSMDGDVVGIHETPPSYDNWVLQVSKTGALRWQQCLGGTQNDQGMSVIQLADSSFVIGGSTYSTDGDVTVNHGSNDYWLVKLAGLPDTTHAPSAVNTVVAESNSTVYPNPATKYLYVGSVAKAVAIYNITGQLVQQGPVDAIADVAALAPGMYYLQLYGDNRQLIKVAKFVKE